MSRLFYQRLDTVGDGSGTSNMNVDGSSTPVTFKITPPSGESIKLARIMIFVEDSGSFDSGKWGNGITLTNGLDFKEKDSGVTNDLLGFSIKTSGDMASVCHDFAHAAFGSGNEFISFRWTFTKAGQSIGLSGSDGDEFQLIVNDDMTGLAKMYVMAQGHYL